MPGIRCPIFVIQGTNDESGTMRRLEAIERRAGAGAEHGLLAGCGHSPQRRQRKAALAAAVEIMGRIADRAVAK